MRWERLASIVSSMRFSRSFALPDLFLTERSRPRIVSRYCLTGCEPGRYLRYRSAFLSTVHSELERKRYEDGFSNMEGDWLRAEAYKLSARNPAIVIA
jgi:hypothetical protein